MSIGFVKKFCSYGARYFRQKNLLMLKQCNFRPLHPAAGDQKKAI
jgi:hypothetical protein